MLVTIVSCGERVRPTGDNEDGAGTRGFPSRVLVAVDASAREERSGDEVLRRVIGCRIALRRGELLVSGVTVEEFVEGRPGGVGVRGFRASAVEEVHGHRDHEILTRKQDVDVRRAWGFTFAHNAVAGDALHEVLLRPRVEHNDNRLARSEEPRDTRGQEFFASCTVRLVTCGAPIDEDSVAVHARCLGGLVVSGQPAEHAVLAEDLVAELAKSRGGCALIVVAGCGHYEASAAGSVTLESFQPLSVHHPVALAELGSGRVW